MANDVIVREYSAAGVLKNGSIVPIYEEDTLITTQFLDIGVESAAFNTATRVIAIDSKAAAFQYKFGQSGVSAVANAAGNSFLPASATRDFQIGGHTHIDTVADA